MEKIGSINPFGLRMEKPLRDALEKAAKSSGRSLNAEVVSRLNESLSVVYEQGPRRARPLMAQEAPPQSPRLRPEEELVLDALRELEPERQLAFFAFLRAIGSVGDKKRRKAA